MGNVFHKLHSSLQCSSQEGWRGAAWRWGCVCGVGVCVGVCVCVGGVCGVCVCVCVWSHACICMCVCLHIGACPSAFELVHGMSYEIARDCVRVAGRAAIHAYLT